MFADPSTPEKHPRDRTFKLKHIRLDITLDEKEGSVRGTSTLTLTPINDGLTSVELDAVDMEVRSVREVKGRRLDHEYRDGVLVVRLGRPRRAGTDLVLAVRYACRPKKGMFFIRPDKEYPGKPWQIWTQGEEEDNRHWFPSYDSPNDKATTEIIVTVQDGFVAVSNGRLVRETRDTRRRTRTFHWVQDVPHANYLVAVCAGAWDVKEDAWDGVPLQYLVPKGRGKEIDLMFGETRAMMDFFSEVTGVRYPYARYAQVVVNDFIFGGMENTSLTVLTEVALHDARARPDYMPDGLVSHELAHQWFGDYVTAKSWGHLWLNESFASYFDPLWWEHRYGRDAFHQRMALHRDAYMKEASKSYARAIVTPKYVEGADMLDAHTYEKGAWVLHMMRHALGDGLWWKSIRHYLQTHAMGTVETNDFKIAIEEATGRNLDGFFDQWLYRAGHPEFEVSWSYDDKSKLVALTVRQKQKVDAATPPFRTPVDVEMRTGDKARRERIEVSRAEQTFYLASKSKPDAVLFDPDDWILKTLTFEKGKEELLYQLRHADRIAPRIQACEGLGKILHDEPVVEALHRALTKDPWYGVRSAAAKALGEVRTQAAKKALLAGTKDKDSRVRSAVYEALGQFRGDDEALRALRTAWLKDRAYYAAASAATGLGAMRHEKVFDTIARNLDRPAHANIVTRRGLLALAEFRDAKAIPILERYTRRGHPELVRGTAAVALGTLGNRLEGKDVDDIRDVLVRLLRDDDFRTRLGALQGLATMEDPAAISELQKMREYELHGVLRNAARRGIVRIREAEAKKSRKIEQEKEIQTLQDENRDLKGRVAKLEEQVKSVLSRKRGRKR